MNATDDVVKVYFVQRVREGNIPTAPNGGGWPPFIRAEHFIQDFINFCEGKGYAWPSKKSAETAFGKAIKTIRVVTRFRTSLNGKPIWCYRLPLLDEARAVFCPQRPAASQQ